MTLELSFMSKNGDIRGSEYEALTRDYKWKWVMVFLNILTKRMTQTYPTDWDVDDYKDDTEPDEHWELRKAFMETHQGKFSEEYLVALARTFTNIEFMGCSYPAPVMVKIAELSKEVAQNYRESKKNKLQRTFVSASNAAENKIKKRSSDPGTYTTNANKRR